VTSRPKIDDQQLEGLTRSSCWQYSDSKGKFMGLRTMRMLCTDGDKALADWDTDNLTPQRLSEIEIEFNSRIQEGFFAADVTDNRNVLINKFDPSLQILLVPRVQGG
jgi:hypothetical protein